MSNLVVTADQLKRVLPPKLKTKVNDELVDTINNITDNDYFKEAYRENILGFIDILKGSNYRIGDYINAVKYVSYKLMGSSNIEAYTKTFPHRYQKMINEGVADISPYVSAYSKNQLVNKILEQSLIPTHLLNADIFQKAINIQASIMVDQDASYKVRSDAANSLLTHLKRPEASKIELDIGYKDDKTIEELRNTTAKLAAQQRQMIESGLINAQQIAHSKIIEGEVIDG